MATFSVRDDDINYFTDVEQLACIYDPLLDWLRPTLCITPYAGELYLQVREREGELIGATAKLEFARTLLSRDPQLAETRHSIYDRPALLQLLRRWVAEQRVEIALHGITHNVMPQGFECETTPPSLSAFREIKAELETTLGCSVRVFSPPNNSISGGWWKLIGACEMNVVHSIGPRPHEVPASVRSWFASAVLMAHYALHRRTARYPYPLDYGVARVLPSYPLLPFAETGWLSRELIGSACTAANFVLAIHSYALSHDRNVQGLSDLIGLARTLRYQPRTIGQCFG